MGIVRQGETCLYRRCAASSSCFAISIFIVLSYTIERYRNSYFPTSDRDLEHLTMLLPIKSHHISPRNSIFENDAQKRGFIVVIILSVLATVGMFCLIISLVICKNKRDRKNKAAIVNAEMRMPGSKSRYRKLEDEEEAEGGVWSVEMDDRRPTAYKDGQQYGQVCGL